jgi:hypothetical protein
MNFRGALFFDKAIEATHQDESPKGKMSPPKREANPMEYHISVPMVPQ